MKTNQTRLVVAAIQMTTGCHIDKNLQCAEALISKAVAHKAKMVVLPEYFAIMGENEKAKIALAEKSSSGKVYQFLSTLAKRFQIWLVGGSHAFCSNESERPFGRCLVFSPTGELVTYYDKIHLFDVIVENKLSHIPPRNSLAERDEKQLTKAVELTEKYQESKYCMPGETIRYFDCPWGRVGLAICYDIRFPEMFRALVQQGVKIICVSAAFTHKTGKAHWEILLRARAIENQVYIIASAQQGKHENGRETWGHSCIISPYGDMLDVLPVGEGISIAELDFEAQLKYQRDFPVLSHIKV